uniref:Uncharacterized protein n=1 Tax=Rhizophora mucronata TaxID=61149 RepID=A0A2P2P2N6_RHIMU
MKLAVYLSKISEQHMTNIFHLWYWLPVNT